MATKSHEDLFESTKMTFGEHLEELRLALFRALIGLAVGFLIGLGVAGPVVQHIEGPLTQALERHYLNKAVDELTTIYKEIPEQLNRFIESQKLVFDEVHVEYQELERLHKAWQMRQTEKPRGTAASPNVPSTDMFAMRIWRPIAADVKSLNAHEAFMIWLKAAMITGAVVSSPWVFWQIWVFVAAGLYPNEKHYVYVFLPFSLGLFLSGAALAFFFVFKPVLDFLFGFNAMMNIDPDPRISEWLSFVLFLPLGFGISFQLPLVMLLLERIGVMTVASYLDKWRMAVLVIFVASMLLTPADPISMLLMAIPLTVLYFGGIALCRWMPRRRSPFGEGYDP